LATGHRAQIAAWVAFPIAAVAAIASTSSLMLDRRRHPRNAVNQLSLSASDKRVGVTWIVGY
jgi:hypothetical protein